MRDVTVLSGGMGGARLLRGIRHAVSTGSVPGLAADAEVSVVVNTAGDLWAHGLKVCPDLDTLMRGTGAGAGTRPDGGRDAETWRVRDDLAAYGVEPTWLELADGDVATHLVRTQMLEAGYPLSAVTEALCRRWEPGARLLPMTDDRVETHVALADDTSPSGRRVVHLQEYRTRLRAEVPAEAVLFVGLDSATPAPGVLEAIAEADLVLLAPSDPVVSLGPILGLPGVREALRAATATVVGLSPVVAGRAADPATERMLRAVGVEVDAHAVGLHLGARSSGGVLDGWVVDEQDAGGAAATTAAGLPTRVASIAVPATGDPWEAAAALVAAAVGLAG